MIFAFTHSADVGNRLIFYHFYLSPDVYTKKLAELGYQDITTKIIDLGMPFFLMTAKRVKMSWATKVWTKRDELSYN